MLILNGSACKDPRLQRFLFPVGDYNTEPPSFDVHHFLSLYQYILSSILIVQFEEFEAPTTNIAPDTNLSIGSRILASLALAILL